MQVWEWRQVWEWGQVWIDGWLRPWVELCGAGEMVHSGRGRRKRRRG